MTEKSVFDVRKTKDMIPGRSIGLFHEIKGIMDSVMYRDILSEKMLPHAKKEMLKDWIFQQDNDPKDKSKLVQEF